MKNIKFILLLCTISLFIVSCNIENDNGFQSSPYIVGFENAVATNSYFQDEGVVTAEYPVSLLGGQSGVKPGDDISINFAVNTALSTATEGVEFDLPLPGSLTLPAGSSFALLPVDINTGNFNPNEPTSVFIDISTSTDGITVSAINQTIEIKFVGCLSDVDQYSYSLSFEYTSVGGDFSAYSADDVHTFSLTGTPNNFLADSTPPWGPNGLFGALAPPADRNGYIMEVVCGEVFIVSQNLGNYYANTVEGIAGSTNPCGYVDETTGDIYIDFDVCFAGNCRKLRNVVYTRLN